MMTVSVIITVYNLEKYIGEAIESVLNQTRPADEIIVIDDASTDNSAEIIKSYVPYLRYIRTPKNIGVLLSTIEGLKNNTSDIVTFLDGDDIWEKDKLECVVKAFEEETDVLLVTHGHKYINRDGRLTGYIDLTHKNTRRIIKESGGDKFKMNTLLRNSILGYKGVWLGSAYSFRYDALNLEPFIKWVHKFPNPNLSYQDHPLCAYLLLTNSNKLIYFIDKDLFRYRVFTYNSSGVSVDLNTAMRTLKKLEATTIRTHSIVSENRELKEEIQRQNYKLIEIDYLSSLYQKRFMRSFKLFLCLIQKKWTFTETMKEAQRFFLVVLLGPEGFFKLKLKR